MRAGHRLDQDAEPFAVKLRRQDADAGDVGAWPCQRRDQTLGHHVLAHANNRQRAAGAPERQHRLIIGDDCIGSGGDDFKREFVDLVLLDVETERQYAKVLTLDEAVDPQLVEEGGDARRLPSGGNQKVAMR